MPVSEVSGHPLAPPDTKRFRTITHIRYRAARPRETAANAG